MFFRRRGIMIGIGILALATVSLAATVQVFFLQLPEPEEADGRGLIRWMIIRDLSQETPELRRRLLVRIDEVLGGNQLGSGSINDQLDPQYQPRFWSNVDVLLQEWFYVQSEHYAAASPEQRTAMLDEILDEAKGLSNFQSDSPQEQTDPNIASGEQNADDPLTAVAKFMEKMNGWIECAPPAYRQDVRHFAAALQARMAVRSLQDFMNAFKAGKPADQP